MRQEPQRSLLPGRDWPSRVHGLSPGQYRHQGRAQIEVGSGEGAVPRRRHGERDARPQAPRPLATAEGLTVGERMSPSNLECASVRWVDSCETTFGEVQLKNGI